MATLPTKSFSVIVQQISAGVQGRASALINFAIGSTLRAIAEGFAGVALWLQAMILQLLIVTRASTSTGTDLDSFVNDYGVTRLGAQAASGQLTYSRFTASTSQPFIPVGATVNSSDGSQTVAVTADPTNVNFSASLNGYTMPSLATSIIVPAANVVPGAAGNVGANIFTSSTTTISGIDTVTNAGAFTNGIDAEPDEALRDRFQLFILGMSRGDLYGLAYAIKSMAVNVEYSAVEFYNYAGQSALGYFYVVGDDGSGSPSGAFISNLTTAVNSVRPLGIQAGVFSTTATTVAVNMTLGTATGYDHGTVVGQVATLITNNINAIGQGNGMQFGDLYAWAFSVAGVTSVTGVTMNSLTGDAANIAANPKVTLLAGVIAVS